MLITFKSEDGQVKLCRRDSLDVMDSMETDRIDSIVTDPPQVTVLDWIEAMRALKPGGHLAAVCLPPNYHWWASTIEDVLDPFGGTGDTAEAALREGCSCILIEKNDKYLNEIKRRLAAMQGGLTK
jgi:DNA modification methylase